MAYGFAALLASAFAGLDLSRAGEGFVRAPYSARSVADCRLRVYLGAHNSSSKPNPLRGSA
ncbi:hypothetical protein ABTG86_20390, partial [Acinetobacter baumannii]|jgi:hypothetical protein